MFNLILVEENTSVSNDPIIEKGFSNVPCILIMFLLLDEEVSFSSTPVTFDYFSNLEPTPVELPQSIMDSTEIQHLGSPNISKSILIDF